MLTSYEYKYPQFNTGIFTSEYKNAYFNAEDKISTLAGTLIKTMLFHEHLSDNKEGCAIMFKDMCKPGFTTLIKAPCGAGKTYAIFNALQQKIIDEGMDRTVVLTTPQSIQSEQNSKYSVTDTFGTERHVIPITGNSKNTIDITDNAQSYSVVYDSLQREDIFNNIELHSKMILIIDEAHLLFAAQNYRQQAIDKIVELIDSVISHNGSVVYITGTPRTIEGLHIDIRYNCIPDSDNSYMDKIKLLQLDNKHNNLIDLIVDTAKKYNNAGYKPLFLINNKKSIYDVKNSLTSYGLNVLTLTADDKSYIFDNNHHISYDNKMYGDIIEESVLPEADAYLTTSVITCGTSIVGIKQKDGTIVKDNKIVPVFCCLNVARWDIDDVEQFFARIRYHYDEAAIICKYKGIKEGEEPFSKIKTLEKCKVDMFNKAEKATSSYNLTMAGRASVPTIQGTYEDDNIKFKDGKFFINPFSIIGMAVKVYDTQFIQHQELLPAKMHEIFGEKIIIENHRVNEVLIKVEKGEGYTKVSEKTIAYVQDNLDNEEFIKLFNGNKIGLYDPKFDDFRKACPEATQIYNAVNKFTEFNVFTAKEVLKAVTSDTKAEVVTTDGSVTTVENMNACLVDKYFEKVLTWDTKSKTMAFLFIKGHATNDNRYLKNFYRLSEGKQKILKAIESEARFKDVCKAVNTLNSLGVNSLDIMLKGIQGKTKEGIQEYIRMQTFTLFNEWDKFKYPIDYRKAVLPDVTSVGASYDAIRYVRRGDFTWEDENGQKVDLIDTIGLKVDQNGTASLMHKMLNRDIVKKIAKSMPQAVYNRMHRRGHLCSEQNILALINEVFVLKYDLKPGDRKDDPKAYRFTIVKLRKNVRLSSLTYAGVFIHKDAIGDESVLEDTLDVIAEADEIDNVKDSIVSWIVGLGYNYNQAIDIVAALKYTNKYKLPSSSVIFDKLAKTGSVLETLDIDDDAKFEISNEMQKLYFEFFVKRYMTKTIGDYINYFAEYQKEIADFEFRDYNASIEDIYQSIKADLDMCDEQFDYDYECELEESICA